MKILNVNHMLDPATGGGTAERTFQMSRALAKGGIPCTVLTTDVGLTPERVSDLSPVEVVVFPCISKRFFIPKLSYRKVRQIVANADVIHLMGHWSVLNAIVYLIGSRLNKRYVVCPAGALPVYGRSKLLKKIYNWVIGYKLIANANCCIAVTREEITHFQNYGVPRNRVHVIPNGIMPEDLPAPDPCAFREKYGLGSAPIILFVGRLNQIKGPDLLLEAFCNLKNVLVDFQLVFIGPDGGMLARLKAIAEGAGVAEKVRFLGFIGGADKYQAYFASDLLVIPSRQEAMSIVVLEAGMTGTPVLLTDQCGFRDVEECEGGKIVEASVCGLETGLLRMLDNHADLERMGSALKTYVEEKYLWDNLVHRYLALYRQCL
jgi:glycosyltransferase involved in cell wall biosynthesis